MRAAQKTNIINSIRSTNLWCVRGGADLGCQSYGNCILPKPELTSDESDDPFMRFGENPRVIDDSGVTR